VVEKEKEELVDIPDVTDDLPLVDEVPEDEEGFEEENNKNTKKGKHHGINTIEESLITVTEDNIKNFTIDDVIFPVVGYKTLLPQNEEMKQIMLDVMAEDGITML